MGTMKQFKSLMEALPSKTVVFAFGRFNPPTTGHEILVKLVKKLADAHSADHVIYASRSQDKKKNPLSVDKKLHYLKMMFPGTHFQGASDQAPTFMQVAADLNAKYKNLIMVAGSDRVSEYTRLLNEYNGKNYNFDSIKVISAGERDPDADDATGMSASKMRAAASKGDFETFKKGLPSTVRDLNGKQLMNDIRVGLGLDVIKEQIKFGYNELREKYLSKQIFNIGDVVESAGSQYEILDRGTNYVTVVDQSGNTSRKWLQDCTPVDVVEDIQPGYAPAEITFKGYTTKNLHHSADAVKAFQQTIAKANSGVIQDQVAVLNALKATDAYMKLNDMHLEQGVPPDEKDLAAWREAHMKAKESLDRVGEFLHHMDYWHMHGHEIEDMEANYNPETAGAEMADSYQPQAELVEANFADTMKKAIAAHERGDHTRAKYHLDNAKTARYAMKSTDIAKNKQMIDKYEEMRGIHEGDQGTLWRVEKSEATGKFYIVRGYNKARKVWKNKFGTGDYNSKESAQSKVHELNQGMTEEVEIDEELTDKTIRSGDKIKVARVIADMLGIENAESMSPDSAVNAGLRKVKNKRMTPELVGVIKKMLDLAQEVGIKVDTSLVPKAVSEQVVDPTVDNNLAKGILRIKDFNRLKAASDQNVAVPGEIGHTLHDDDVVRKMKIKYKTEDVASADYKVNPETGRKYRAHKIEFANSSAKDKLDPEQVKEQFDDEAIDFSDSDLDDMIKHVNDPEDVIDAYDDDEIVFVDANTGVPVADMNEDTEQIIEVLSRVERMKAKIRFARTSAKRERSIQIALKTRSSAAKINQRSRRLAINLMKQRLIKKPVSQMTVAEKERAEQMIARRKDAINRLAMKLAPKVRKIESERLSHPNVTK